MKNCKVKKKNYKVPGIPLTKRNITGNPDNNKKSINYNFKKMPWFP